MATRPKLASTHTRQKRRVSREYSNSLNSPASSHCLVLFKVTNLLSIPLNITHIQAKLGTKIVENSNLEFLHMLKSRKWEGGLKKCSYMVLDEL